MSIVSLNGLTKPEALAALFNYAKPQGLGMLHYKPDHRMDSLESGIVLKQGMCVDYLEGRVIKVDFGRSGDTIDTRLYDRDNGIDAGLKAIRYAIDKKDGGFMGDMCLPLHIGMSEIRRLTFKNPKIRIGTGRPEWGAEHGKQYFVITWEA